MPPKIYFRLWLLALLPRLALAIVYFQHPIALDDMFQYDMLARSILKGNGYRWYNQEDFETLRPYYSGFLDMENLETSEEGLLTTHRAPGYPIFLTGIYSIAPEETRFGWVRIAQAAFTATLAPLSALIAIHSGLGKKAAKIAGVSIGFYPLLLFYPLALASENFFIPTLAAGFLFLLLAQKSKKWSHILLSGLLLGANMFTRSISALFVIFGAWWVRTFGKLDLKKVGIFLALAFGICAPWAIRNTRIMGKPTFMESSLGYNLFISYHPEGNGGFISDIAIKPLNILDDVERDKYCTEKALQFIKSDPGEALIRVLRKVAFFFSVEDREMAFFYGNGIFGHIPQPWLGLIYLILITPWILIIFLAPVGMLISQRRAPVYLALGLLAGYSAPHFLIIAEPRFHLALVPILLPYAAHAWAQRKKISTLGKWHRIILATIWLILAALLIWSFSMNWDKLTALMGPDGYKIHLSY
ncbi:MAG: hypothetical protein B6I38_04740 [Anaerolineaceae bacterium 4572_5.1]|nr:MAG: hypothetical protein B6I38_04740 [Anaerolineaceae bacterium 4572_5.1]